MQRHLQINKSINKKMKSIYKQENIIEYEYKTTEACSIMNFMCRDCFKETPKSSHLQHRKFPCPFNSTNARYLIQQLYITICLILRHAETNETPAKYSPDKEAYKLQLDFKALSV